MPIFIIPNVLTALLEYIYLLNLSGSIKQTFGRGTLYPCYTVFLHFILSLAIELT